MKKAIFVLVPEEIVKQSKILAEKEFRTFTGYITNLLSAAIQKSKEKSENEDKRKKGMWDKAI